MFVFWVQSADLMVGTGAACPPDADCTGDSIGPGLLLRGFGLVLGRDLACSRCGRLCRRFGTGCRFSFGGGLRSAFAKQLFFGQEPEFQILTKRAVSLLPEVVGQQAGLFCMMFSAVGRCLVHRSVVLGVEGYK